MRALYCIVHGALSPQLKEGKAIAITGYVGRGVVRHQGSNISYTGTSRIAVRLSAVYAGCPLPPGRFLVLIWSAPGQLQGLGQLRNPVTSLGIEPPTLQVTKTQKT
jgi:hypothetical protein